MKIYLAIGGNRVDAPHVLIPFFGVSKSIMHEQAEKGSEIVLDSGAYSAWSLGKQVNLDDYITFIHEHKQHLSWYANLDVITDDPSESAEPSFDNFKVMKAAGLDPVPVFHFGEDPKWLKCYLEMSDFIALGGVYKYARPRLYSWLDDVFTEYLTDDKGMPTCKVHGFGWTGTKLINRYPWYSVDSSSWVQLTVRGQTWIPHPAGETGYDFTRSPRIYELYVAANNRRENIWLRDEREQKFVWGYIKSKGLPIGRSEIKWIPKDQSPPKNGKLLHELRDINQSNKGEFFRANKLKLETMQPVEIIKRKGVCNDRYLRGQLLVAYYQDLGEAFPRLRPFLQKTAFKSRRFFS